MGVTGANFATAAQSKSQARVMEANARIARAQGQAARGRAYGQATRIERQNEQAGREANTQLERLRGQQRDAMGAAVNARGTSGFAGDGSKQAVEVSVLSAFEQRAADMAHARSLEDMSARFSASMARQQGDLADMGANINADYTQAQAGLYRQLAINAQGAGIMQGVALAAGAATGALTGAGALTGMTTAGSLMSNLMQFTPGTAESKGLVSQDYLNLGQEYLGQQFKKWWMQQ